MCMKVGMRHQHLLPQLMMTGKKRKLGRPLKGGAALTEQVNFRLTEHEARCLRDYCFRYDVSPSDAIRWCLHILSVTGL